MKELIKKIFEKYHNLKDFQAKLFWIAVPIVILIGLITFVCSLIEHQPGITLLLVASCFVFPSLIAWACIRTQKTSLCYGLLCFFLNCFLIPATFLCGGGAYSGMPIFCAGAAILCSFCGKKSLRYLLLTATILIDTAVFILSFTHPESILTLEQEVLNSDIYYSYLLVAVALFIIGNRLITVYELNHQISTVLEDHLDKRVSEALLQQGKGVKLSERSNVAVLFADICNFTSISESMDSETLAEYLDTYFDIAEKAVHGNDGVIDKYIGDCVMAYWRDDSCSGNAALLACRAAMDMKRMLKERCAEVNDRFFCDLEYTAGINYGTAFIGDIGSEKHKEFTVIGDTVNVASRIQSIAPQGGAYLSEAVARQVQGKAHIVRVPKKVAIKGKTDPLDIYTLVSMDPNEAEELEFEEKISSGYILYICGSRGSYSLAGKRYAEFGGETSCYVIKKGTYALIIDCGSGLQRARAIIEKCTKIDIILTHLHYDHIIGLMDWSIFPKDAELTFYGTFDKWRGEDSIRHLFEGPYWPVDLFSGKMVTVDHSHEYSFGQDITARFYPASHPDNTSLVALNVQNKRVCVMADCENPEDLPESVVSGCDILIYDGMYEDAYYHEHVGWGHSTWQSGVRLAVKTNPKRLIITHHNPRNSDEKLRGLEIQAQETFPATTFAKAGDRFSL